MAINTINIYTDGAARGNPGPGGWAASIRLHTGKISEIGGAEGHTTNNRMELMAIWKSLDMTKAHLDDVKKVIVHTDSAYAINGITKWVYGWFKNGWLTREGEPVLNQDLWEPLYQMVWFFKPKCELIFKKVEGHSGDLGNERADLIATKFADGERILLYAGGERDYERLLKETVAWRKAHPKKVDKTPAYSYVSKVGDLVEVHKTWSECQARVIGKAGAKFKKTKSKDEELALISEWTMIKS